MGREAPTGARRFSSSRGDDVHEARLADEAQHPVPYPWLFVGMEPGERSPRSSVRPTLPPCRATIRAFGVATPVATIAAM